VKELRQQRRLGVGRSETVLVVDDEPHVRDLVTRILVHRGYRVQTASDGEQALSLLAAGGRVDAILTDTVMPQMSGPEFARRAQELRAGIKVLYMSGYDRDGVLATAGITSDVFIAKPFSSEELAEKLRVILDAVDPR
jgi:CheY-like chemotaxis protein